MSDHRAGRIFIPLFGGTVTAFVVWVAGGPLWAVIGFGVSVVMLAAIAEDHFHGS